MEEIIKPKNLRFKFYKNIFFITTMYVFYILIFYMLYSLTAQDFWQEEKVHCVRTQCLLLTFWNHASSSSENQPHILWRVSLLSKNHNHNHSSSNSSTQTLLQSILKQTPSTTLTSSHSILQITAVHAWKQESCVSLTVYMRNSNSDAWLHKTSVIFHLVGHVT